MHWKKKFKFTLSVQSVLKMQYFGHRLSSGIKSQTLGTILPSIIYFKKSQIRSIMYQSHRKQWMCFFRKDYSWNMKYEMSDYLLNVSSVIISYCCCIFLHNFSSFTVSIFCIISCCFLWWWKLLLVFKWELDPLWIICCCCCYKSLILRCLTSIFYLLVSY